MDIRTGHQVSMGEDHPHMTQTEPETEPEFESKPETEPESESEPEPLYVRGLGSLPGCSLMDSPRVPYPAVLVTLVCHGPHHHLGWSVPST